MASNPSSNEDGDIYYRDDAGNFHREDGPAKIFMSKSAYDLDRGGQIEYWIDNKIHRIDGPAVITEEGDDWWLINGIDVTTKVRQWIIDNSLSANWLEWTDAEKVLFRLNF